MKGIKLFVLLIFSLIIISFYINAQMEVHPMGIPPCKGENCGKVVGWIIDYNTKLPVEEKFHIGLVDCDRKDVFGYTYAKAAMDTDNRGYFSFTFPEGNYCFIVMPFSKNSKYCGDPYPGYTLGPKQHIKIRRRQITKIKKVVKLGGWIKLKFVDSNGINVDIKTIFPTDLTIYFKVRSKWITPVYENAYDLDKMAQGYFLDKAAYNLTPGIYDGIVHFGYPSKFNMVYGSQIIEGIEVEAGKTTEALVVVDMLNKKTGIKGKIADENGNPLKEASVQLFSETSHISMDYGDSYFLIEARCDTNARGFYKIIGLDSSYRYELRIYYKRNDGSWVHKVINSIELREGLAIERNIVLNVGNKN